MHQDILLLIFININILLLYYIIIIFFIFNVNESGTNKNFCSTNQHKCSKMFDISLGGMWGLVDLLTNPQPLLLYLKQKQHNLQF